MPSSLISRSGIDGTPVHPLGTGPLAQYDLANVDCPKCGNTGQFWWRDPKEWITIHCQDCVCMPKRKIKRTLKQSGLEEIIDNYTFEKYKADTAQTAKLLEMAKAFIKNESDWFFLSGKPGSGKTHLCTAITCALIDQGKTAYYMVWREEISKLKFARIDTDREENEKKKETLKNVQVLYIDDFFKGQISAPEVQLAFEIINYRYNHQKHRTIISTELPMDSILRIDEGLGRRIVERAGSFCLTSPNVDYSLKRA